MNCQNNIIKLFFISLVGGLSFFNPEVRGDVTLPNIFNDNMVLQRDMPVPVWGWADKGEEVSVTFGSQAKRTVADQDGKWMVKLDAMKANKNPVEMTVKGKNTVSCKNVLVGEVWLCSGQSNMERSVARSLNRKEEVAKASYPEIRYLGVNQKSSDYELSDVTCSDWKICSPKVVERFSGVAYFFGRTLYKKLDVPVGLIHSSWGGSPIERWLCPQGIRMVPELNQLREKVDGWDVTFGKGRQAFAAYLAEMKNWNQKAEKALDAKQNIPTPPEDPRVDVDQRAPLKYYNAMIYPLIPFAIRGVIWYQGESNGNDGMAYFHKMNALVKGWRKVWGQGDFPFIFVQIANYKADKKVPGAGDGYAGLRDAQKQSLEIPNTGMVVTIDIGETRDIHPKNKQDVGKRLARWALADTYGVSIVPSGPLYKSHKIEGNKIRIFFDYVGGGLMVGEKNGLAPVKEIPNGKLKRFAIAGKDRKFYWAEAVIDGDTVVVSSDKVSAPVAVRYAYSANPLGCNLYNKAGLPASPFRTDN